MPFLPPNQQRQSTEVNRKGIQTVKKPVLLMPKGSLLAEVKEEKQWKLANLCSPEKRLLKRKEVIA